MGGGGGGRGAVGCFVCLFACFSFFSPVGQRLALQAVEMAGGFPRRGFTGGCFPVVCTSSTSGWLPIDVGHDAGFGQHGADAGCDKLPPLLLPQPPSSSPPLHSQTPPIPETPPRIPPPLLPPRASPDPPPTARTPLPHHLQTVGGPRPLQQHVHRGSARGRHRGPFSCSAGHGVPPPQKKTPPWVSES